MKCGDIWLRWQECVYVHCTCKIRRPQEPTVCMSKIIGFRFKINPEAIASRYFLQNNGIWLCPHVIARVAITELSITLPKWSITRRQILKQKYKNYV